MKIRNGFVSNSSSSSFLLFGLYTDSESELEQMMGLNKNEEDESADPEMDADEADLDSELYEKCGAACVDYHRDYEGGGYYIGLSWDSVGDDETGRQFKERVKAAIKKVLPKISDETLAEVGTHDAVIAC